ncbi:unnamed protein product [Musa textilis]
MCLIFQAKLVKLDVVDDPFPSTTLLHISCILGCGWRVPLGHGACRPHQGHQDKRRGSSRLHHLHVRDRRDGRRDSPIWRPWRCVPKDVVVILQIKWRWIVQALHKGWLSQHHVDSKSSEILCRCMTKEALNLVIFYVDFEKGSTPTSVWTVGLSKTGGKRELRYTWNFRTVVFDIPRNGGEVLVRGRGRQKNRCMEVGEACLE